MRLLAALFITFLATSSLANDGPLKAPEPPKTFDIGAIDTYVEAMVQHRGVTGLGLAIVRDGKFVLAKGYGRRSIADGAPVQAETPFAIGSVTKQFVCACILLLAEEGKLSVDDKVARYFPNLTRAGDITLYQLMTHTSGYPDYYPLDFVDRRMNQSIAVDAVIQKYGGGKLDFEPATRWSYSNTGYLILGRVVEKVSGQSLGSFLGSRLLRPAGMEKSTFEPDQNESGHAVGYLSFALGPREPAPPEANGWLHAAGGLWTSAPDLARWNIALMEGQILKPTSFALMSRPVTLASGRHRDYGCGLAVKRDGGETILSHGGAVSGFKAFNAMVPRTRSSVSLLCNDEQSETALSQTILDLLTKPEGEPEVPHVAGPPAKEAAINLLRQMQTGQVDRKNLGEEFSIYLTDDRLHGASARFKSLGEPEKVEVEKVYERGGMEVASIRMTFQSTVLHGLLYRTPDGKIQQFLLDKG